MGLPNVMNTGRSAMVAARANIATTGHNIANANTEGFSRQRVIQEAATPLASSSPRAGSKIIVGDGVRLSRVERINDEYVEKQLRQANKDLAFTEERDLALRQTEDIFNELNGDGLNRLVARFFNQFRQLANEPDSEAIRQSVREASQAVVNDFHRMRQEIEDVRKHIDSRLEGECSEVNAVAEEIRDLNQKIHHAEITGASPNDLLDRRDNALRRLGTYMDLAMHKDKEGLYNVDVVGVGPLISGPSVQKFSVFRSPADEAGKPEEAVDVATSSSARSIVTHQLKGGKLGALLETRDQTLSTVLAKLDDLAFTVSQAVNSIHEQGFTRYGQQGVAFFKPLDQRERASEFIDLSDELKASVNHIAAAAVPDAPGDNRIAMAIANIQNLRCMSDGKASLDDYYNSIVSDVGVVTARNRATLNQNKDIQTQLSKIRDQISGVSIDEETANLLQFQHSFDASAKVIQVADECLKTVLELHR